ncbi:MAG: DedA family protein [Anaerolineae bacterium]|nr:DedA family protein [Anaerolineae bacterium]
MTDINITDFLLTAIINYGAFAFGATLVLGGLGVPVPGSLAVIAVGGFVRQGIIDWPSAVLFGVAGAVLGDSISYGLGRFAGEWIERRFGHSTVWQNAQATFQKRGGLAIYLTRWLLTPIAIPTNLIAGGSRYPFWRFLIYDLGGEVTWIVLFGGLGYAFGSQWELISQFISDFSGLLVGVVIFAGGIYGLFRYRQRRAATDKQEAIAS